LVTLLPCLMLPVTCKSLWAVTTAAATVLRGVLVDLLRTRAKMLWSGAIVASNVTDYNGSASMSAKFQPQRTLPAGLLRCERRLLVRHVGAHAINRLALLRTLMCHHWCGRSTRARVTIGSWDRLWRAGGLGNELMGGTGVHLHLWSGYQALGAGKKLGLNHHMPTQVPRLLGNVLGSIGETPVLSHLWRPGSYKGLHHRLVIRNLSRRVDSWCVSDRHRCHPG
jgi:hypothetical protein